MFLQPESGKFMAYIAGISCGGFLG